MRLLVEDYAYTNVSVIEYLNSTCCLDLKKTNESIKINNVGYLYDANIKDCVFILPKVILEGGVEDNNNKGAKIFEVSPDDVFDFNSAVSKYESLKKQQDFLSTLAFWIYQTINVFKKLNPNTKIIKRKNSYSLLDNTKRKVGVCLPDIILSLLKFNEDNRQLLSFTIQLNHSGQNKINWQKTISKSTPFINGNVPIYLSPITHKKRINFEEELIVVFYSILNYISETFHKKVEINNNFELIKGKAFKYMLTHSGVRYMQSIKYKYFSDKMLLLWVLCYAFFKNAQEVHSSSQKQDYLLVSDFEEVFESIIDYLIGEKIPKGGLKKQKDGKIIDHLYRHNSFTNEKQIFYIGDSKYYKFAHKPDGKPLYKQFTYAKNVIQYNLDLFNKLKKAKTVEESFVEDIYTNYLDTVTLGYNITPNFFISAVIKADHLDYKMFPLPEFEGPNKDNEFLKIRNNELNIQLKNSLFDRDTLLVSQYIVNFLHIISLYAGQRIGDQNHYRQVMRQHFRDGIIARLNNRYNFHIVRAKEGNDLNVLIEKHFRKLIGKIYKPVQEADYFILALDKAFKLDNQQLMDVLALDFTCIEYKLGNPIPIAS